MGLSKEGWSVNRRRGLPEVGEVLRTLVLEKRSKSACPDQIAKTTNEIPSAQGDKQ
jgi:hypothetical protein